MAMQFNPHTAFLRGMDLGSPTTSQGGINNLLQMQQNTLGNLVDSFGNIGKTSRTNTVNDLIARGGLEGLNEAQTQARIQQEAGGTLTPEGQAQVNQLLQTAGKNDQRNFTTSERLSGQDFTSDQQQKLFGHQTNERLGRQTFDTSERLSGETFKAGESKKDRDMRVSEGRLDRDVQKRGQYKEVQGADGMWYNVTPEGKMIPLVKGLVPNSKDGSGSGSSEAGEKLTGYTKDFWKQSIGDTKQAIELFDSTGKFNTKMTQKKNEDGTKTNVYQMQFYGQPISSVEMVNFLRGGQLPSRFKNAIPKKDLDKYYGK